MVSHRETIDPVALVEALLGRKVDRNAMASAIGSSPDASSEYDTLVDLEPSSSDDFDQQPRPDEQPKNLRVGCISPYALVEALVGQKMDRCSINAARIIADVLATDYDELFDMKHDSVLFAGLGLEEQGGGGNTNGGRAKELEEKDIKILDERDLETPDLSRVQRLDDIEKLGLKDILQAHVKTARIQNGKLRMVINARSLGKTVSNKDVTESINDLCLPFRNKGGNKDQNKGWSPPNASWRDMYQNLFQCAAQRMLTGMDLLGIGSRLGFLSGFQQQQQMLLGHGAFGAHETCSPRHHQFDDPVQGALGNSYFIAALFSVFWSDPSIINRCVQPLDFGHMPGNRDNDNDNDSQRTRKLQVKFFDKGGENNAKTQTIEVDYRIPTNNSDNQPLYCRSSSGCAVWPSLYEKAYAKWIASENNNARKSDSNTSDQPDMTRIHSGDPVKAMAQINNRKPEYFFTEKRSGRELVGLVRACSVNFKTISPMVAYTHATGNMFRGSNLVANHAYSVLGWAELGQRQHIILRNPFGVTEHPGLTSYPGIMDRVEPDFWSPATLLDCGGVLAVEATAFKEYFACLGVAKNREKNEGDNPGDNH